MKPHTALTYPKICAESSSWLTMTASNMEDIRSPGRTCGGVIPYLLCQNSAGHLGRGLSSFHDIRKRQNAWKQDCVHKSLFWKITSYSLIIYHSASLKIGTSDKDISQKGEKDSSINPPGDVFIFTDVFSHLLGKQWWPSQRLSAKGAAELDPAVKETQMFGACCVPAVTTFIL